MTYRDRLSNFTIETENGDLFVFEYRDLNIKRDEQTGTFEFQDSIPFVQKTFHGAEKHQYELYLSGEDYDIQAAEFWEATKPRTPITVKYPSREKAVNAQILTLEQVNNHQSGEGEAIFRIDFIESAILDQAAEDTTRQAYIGQQYRVVQEANSKRYYVAKPDTPGALQKAINAMKKATEMVNKALLAYEYAADTLADLKSIERTCAGLADTIETSAELFAQAFQGYIELAVNAGEDFVKINFIDYLIDLFDVFGEDVDDDSKLMLSTALFGGLILAATQTPAEIYGSKLAVFERSEKIFAYYEKIIDLADTLEIESDLIIQLNSLINLTAARLEKISFQAKQQRTIELKKTEELYTLVYRLIPCQTSEQLETEIENFIKTNKIGGKELFELESGRRLNYYL